MSQPQKHSKGLAKTPLSLWFGILSIYILLFSTTGYFSFVKKDQSPLYTQYAEISNVKDEDTQKFMFDLMKREEIEHIERQNLASQSFHIVLGALLGFMSASASSLLTQEEDK